VSCHYYNEKEIARGGYYELPYVVDRWVKDSVLPYGWSPAWMVLPVVKQIQVMEKALTRGVQKQVDPTPLISDRSKFGKQTVSFDPGKPVMVKGTPLGGKPVEFAVSPARIDYGYEHLDRKQSQVIRAFYVDAVRDLSMRMGKSPLTATEVMARRDEVFRLLGPAIHRRNQELLVPLCERAYAAAKRFRLIPPAPRKLRGQSFNFEFTSTAALAQRKSEIEDITGWLGSVMPVFQLDQRSLANLDADRLVRHMAMLHNVAPKLLRRPEAVEQANQMAAQQQQMAQMMEMARSGGEAAAAAGEGAAAAQMAGLV
jgi:hypothetical protein